MNRRFGAWLAAMALALRLVAPLAAHASAVPLPGASDICSVDGTASMNAAAADASPLPTQRPLLSHCADCPGACAAAALPPAIGLPAFDTGEPRLTPLSHRASAVTAPTLHPPARGPPSNPASTH